MPHRGYDAFFPDPGAFDRMTCKVCGANCTVTRGLLGPTNFTEAVAHITRLHDRFVCPYSDIPWHTEALELLREAEAERDPLLIRAFRYRLRRLVARHRPDA